MEVMSNHNDYRSYHSRYAIGQRLFIDSDSDTPLDFFSSNHIYLLHFVVDIGFQHKTLATMAKGKAKNVVIKMLSAAGTGFFYTTTKNPRNVTRKLSLRKYDPVVRQHVIFNETKIKKG